MRQIRRGALVTIAVVGGMPAVVAGQYQSMFRDALDGTALRALADNPAIRVLFGPPLALDDPGGFTVWRTGTPVLVLVAVWALLTATRVTRGEEDAGRWDLLLAGRLRPADLVGRWLAVLAAAALLLGAAVAVALLATGTDPTGAVVHAAGIALTTVTFAAGGLLAAQLLPIRATATGVTVAALGAGLALRMLADGVPQLAWVAWLTPFGLTARAAPYATNRVVPLVVLAALALLLAVAALVCAGHRDVGGAVVRVRTSRAPRTRLLGSLAGFAVHRAIRPTAGWAAGIAAYFVLIGALLATVLDFLRENPRFADLAAAAGFTGLGTVTGFAAAMFSLLAIPVGLYAATRIGTMAAEERARRWTSVFAAPVARNRLAAIETGATAAGAAVLLVVAGLAMWLGSTLTGAGLGAGAALAGALNVAPVALLGLGAAVLALGWLPSAVGAIGTVPVAGGFLLDVLARSAGAPNWVVGLSPFTHLAAVPDTAPDWPATAALTAVAAALAALAALGAVGYARRDLST